MKLSYDVKISINFFDYDLLGTTLVEYYQNISWTNKF